MARDSLQSPFLPNWAFLLMAIALGGGLTAYVLGTDILNPANTALLLRGDIGVHYLGWAFFRYEEWTFPIGSIPDFFYPQGANVGYTDSIPLMAILLKPFHSILPQDFQYIGWYLLICQVLQVWTAWLLLGAVGIKNQWARLFGSLFFSVAPVWYFRWVHPALCSHYVLLGSLWVYMGSRDADRYRPWIWRQIFLLTISAYTHPYLGAMTLAISVAWIFRLWRIDQFWKVWQALIAMIGAAGIILLNWWIIGYFEVTGKEMGTVGLGEYSLNLLAFLNPLKEYSTFLPVLPHMEKQYEGIAYLGVGMLIMLMLAIGLRVQKGKGTSWSQWTPLWMMCILMALFALSPEIYVGKTRLMMYSWADFIEEKAQIFRATGRFVWPLYYTLAAGILAAVYHRIKHVKWMPILFGLLLVVQVVDLVPMFKIRMFFQNADEDQMLGVSLDAWEPVIEESDRIMFWPPYMWGAVDYIDMPWLAAHFQKPITLGYVARYDREERQQFVDGFEQDLIKGQFDPNVLYVFDPGKVPDMSESRSRLRLLQLDNYAVGISVDANSKLKQAFEQTLSMVPYESPQVENLVEFFERNKTRTCLISMKDEATYKLSEDSRRYLSERGSEMEKLTFRRPWIGIWHRDSMIWEEFAVDGQNMIEHTWAKGDSLGEFLFQKSIMMKSSNYPGGNLSRLKVDKREYSPNSRGLNVVVLDSMFQVLEAANFDTYQTNFHMSMPRMLKSREHTEKGK